MTFHVTKQVFVTGTRDGVKPHVVLKLQTFSNELVLEILDISPGTRTRRYPGLSYLHHVIEEYVCKYVWFLHFHCDAAG